MPLRSILIATFALSALVGCSKNTDAGADVVEEEQAQQGPATDAIDTATDNADAAPNAENAAKEGTENDTGKEAVDVDASEVAIASKALKQFGTGLYQQLQTTDGENNLAISPWSIQSALIMTAAGAKGNTLAQMLYSLGFVQLADDPAVMQTAFAALSNELLRAAVQAQDPDDDDDDDDDQDDSDDDGLILHAANAIWVADQLRSSLREDFEQTLKDIHHAEVNNAPFQNDADAARQTINRWIATHTDDKIKDLLPPGAVDRMTSMVLTNAIAFDADWTHPFDEKNTRKKPFRLLSGDTVDVQLMNQRLQRGSYWEADHFAAVALPYEAGDYAMSVVVPHEGQFVAVRDALFENGYESVFIPAADRRTEIVNVFLPRFTFRWRSSLTTALKALGMENAFDNRADFSRMFTEESHLISDVIHEVYIEVDEEGTEAAAATGVIVSTTSMPAEPPKVYDVRADRPFLFAIHDIKTNTPVFLGQVVNPVEK